MKFGVQHETRCVEQFVGEGVPVQRLVLKQSGMQADGDFHPGQGVYWASSTTHRIRCCPPRSEKHAETVVVHVEPFHGEPVGNPRKEDGLDVP